RPKANEQVQAKAKKVFALLKDAKIPERDIVVQDLSSEPKYESDDSDPKKRGKLIGYSVTRRFEVKVGDLPRFGKLVGQIIGLREIEFSHIGSGLSNEKELEDELW